jgi:nucleoside-triphosphatase
MNKPKRVYLLTGNPGTGKTTLIKTVASELGGKAGGFYTEEIRGAEGRLGFRLITLDGKTAILAHVKIKSPCRVGRYGVDVSVIEGLGARVVRQAILEREVIIIDEIGKMELFSPGFKEAVLSALDSGKKILGTIMISPNAWADAIKKRPEVDLIPVTRANNQRVLAEIREWLKSAV